MKAKRLFSLIVVCIFSWCLPLSVVTGEEQFFVEAEYLEDPDYSEMVDMFNQDDFFNAQMDMDYNTIADLSDITMYLGDNGGGGKNHYDIRPLGKKYIKHPNIAPFHITPKSKGEQFWPSVAFDGTNYLVVWREDNAVPCGNGVSTRQSSIRGARVTQQGKVLDPGGFTINNGSFGYIYPKVAYGYNPTTGKGRYLVVWQDVQKRKKIWGAIVTPGGKVITTTCAEIILQLTGKDAVESPGIPIFWELPSAVYGDSRYYSPDVCFNGTDFVVVCKALSWGQGSSGYKKNTYIQGVVARMVDLDGFVKLDQSLIFKSNGKNWWPMKGTWPYGPPLTITIASIAQSHDDKDIPRIASGGGNECVVTWTQNTQKPLLANLYATRLSFNGSKITVGKHKLISDYGIRPYSWGDIAANGKGGYFLAWHDKTLMKVKSPEIGGGYTADLFKTGLETVSWDKTLLKHNGWGGLYEKMYYEDFYPQVAYDKTGNYLVISNTIEKDPMHKVPKLGCLKNYVLAMYMTPDGKLIDAFLVEPEDGNHASVGDVCFGPVNGLLIYTWINVDKWDNRPKRMIRARIISPSNYVVKTSLVLDVKADEEMDEDPDAYNKWQEPVCDDFQEQGEPYDWYEEEQSQDMEYLYEEEQSREEEMRTDEEYVREER